MGWGLTGALAAAVAYGVATVLQALGARATTPSEQFDARLLWRLLRSTPYVVGLLLDGVGFALSLAALRTLPLFTVQAVVAASLAVTALLGVVALQTRPAMREWLGVAMTTAGLVLLASSAREQHPADIGWSARLGLLAAVVVVGGCAVVIARTRDTGGARDTWALGCLAGLMFGAGGIAARVLGTPHSFSALVVDPSLWAMAAAGVLGLLLNATALQRGSVTVATSAVVVTETLVPGTIGVVLLSDRPAPGTTPMAAVGFALAVGGALMLARYGEAPAPRAAHSPPESREPQAYATDATG